MNFGQFLTYKGSDLDTVKTYAKNGNLIFAEITGSEDGKNDGFYIFGGKAEGLMVTREIFDTYKASIETRIAELERLADMPIPKGEGEDRMTVVEYVASVIASLKTELDLGTAANLDYTTTVRPQEGTDAATDDVLPTELAVRKAIDAAVSSLGTVMEFKGVVEGEQLPAVDTYNAGDVIIWKGEEYVLGTDNAWHEIGQVVEDEAVRTLGGKAGVITLDGSLAMSEDKELSVVLEGISYSPIFKETVDGVEADVDYSKLFDKTTGVTNVKAALDDLYKDHKVISASLNDHETRIAALEALDHTHPTVSGDADTFTVVTETKNGDEVTDYKVSNTLAVHEAEDKSTPAVAGLATDAYVAEAIRRALAWQIIPGSAE